MGLAFSVFGMGVSIRGTLGDIDPLDQESPRLRGLPNTI